MQTRRMMSAPRQVEIIGGGLAGLSLGIGLRRRGIPVLVREAGHYPRHRVCGEFITSLDETTKRVLALEGPLRAARKAQGVIWHEPGQSSSRHQLPEPALCLSRHRLDADLARNFVSAGGELLSGDRGETAPCEGRILACGRRASSNSPWMGLKQHFRGLVLDEDLELHTGKDAYVGVTRVEEDKVNVCGLFSRRGGGGTLVVKCRQAGLHHLADRLQEAEADEGSRCAVAGLDYGRGTGYKDSVSLGDTGGLIPPFTGNGMTVAWQSAALALPHVESWAEGRTDWNTALKRIARDTHRRFRLRLAAGRALHAWILSPARRRCLHFLGRTGLLPFHPLYRLLH
jgi:menaquinone-9 beta-reductase